MTEAAWRRRFRAPRIAFPRWAREAPQRVVYGSDHEGTFETYAVDLDSGDERRLTSRPEGTGYRVPSRIDPSGSAVWWWDDDKGSEFGVWRAQPFGGGAARPATDLAPAYSAGIAIGAGVALVGRSTDEGAEVHLVRDGASRRVYAHRESARVATISADDRLWALGHSEHGDARNPAVRVLDAHGRRVADLADGPGKGLYPLHWSRVPGDERLLVMHERHGRRRPLVLDAARGAEREIELDLHGEVDAEWYPDGRALLIVHEHRGRSELYRYGLGDAVLRRIDSPAGTIAGASVRPDGDVWYLISTATDPLAVRTPDGGIVLPRRRPEVPHGRPYEDLQVGDVHGFLVEPAGRRPHPTIFIVHGGPEANDSDAFSPTVQAWVDHGYAVALVNYRGSTGYGKAWRDAIKGRPGLTELEDIGAVQDRLVADGIADARRTILSGGSWGGYLTLLGLGTEPRRWALGLALVPIGDYVAAFEDEMEPLKRYDAALFGGTPKEIPHVYAERNPITYVDRVERPVFITVGRNDPRCPARSVELYVRRLRARRAAHEVYEYDAGHGSVRVDEQIHQLELQLAFAARHLDTTPPLA